jgi:hypothetical protein
MYSFVNETSGGTLVAIETNRRDDERYYGTFLLAELESRKKDVYSFHHACMSFRRKKGRPVYPKCCVQAKRIIICRQGNV